MKIEIPGYRILKTLGKGGMATVYLAQQESFGRDVALKVMSGRLFDSQDMGERFMQEARIVSQLMHPNIVTVFDVGVYKEQYYLSMEYVDGPDLKTAHLGLSVLQKIRVIRDIARALDYASSRGYVHRDIKPENIMLHASDGRAVLMDFGIARAVETDISLTQTGAAIGTPYYMSPEQANGGKVDLRSDIYSLGAVFFYALTGEVPYSGDSAVAVCIKHISDPIPSLPDELQALQALINKMMAKDPVDRYQNPAELLSALQNVLRSDDYDEAIDGIEWVHSEADASGETKVTPLYSELANTLVENKKSVPMLLIAVSALFILALISAVGFKLYSIEQPETVQASGEVFVAVDSQKPQAPRTSDTPSEPEESGIKAQANKVISGLQNAVQKTEDRLFIKRKPFAEQVSYYRKRLQEDPQQAKVAEELKALRDERVQSIQSYLASGNYKQAQVQLSEAKTLFNDNEAQWKPLEARLNKRAEVEYLMGKAQESLNEQRYDSPYRRNALHYYQKILDLDAQFKPATSGIRNIQNILVAQAQEEFVKGNYASAKRSIDRTLSINPNHREAVKLLANINRQLEKPKTSGEVLEKANNLLAEGKLYSPAGNNAFEYFRRGLEDPDTAESARQGLQRLKQELARQVDRLLAEKNIEAARALLNAASTQLGTDGEVELLHFRVDEIQAQIKRSE